jgi:hypothetical protein
MYQTQDKKAGYGYRYRYVGQVGLMLLVFCGFVGVTHGASFDWALRGGVRFEYHRHPFLLDEPAPQFERELVGANLLLGAYGLLRLSKHIEMAAHIDMGELWLGGRRRGQDYSFALLLNDFQLNSDRAAPAQWMLEESAFLRELYLTMYFGKERWQRLDIGIRHQQIGDAHVYDHFALGLFYEVDWRKQPWRYRAPVRFNAALFLPDSSWTAEGKTSPVGNIALAIVDNRTSSHLTVSLTYMYDAGTMTNRMYWPIWQTRSAKFREREVAPACMLRASRCDELPNASGHHIWAAIHSDIFVQSRAGLGMSFAAIFYGANINQDLPDLPDKMDSFGFLGKFELPVRFRCMTGVTFTPFVIVSTHGEAEEKKPHKIAAFVGLSPQSRFSNAMFSGGINELSSKRSLSLARLSTGYWGTGLRAAYEDRAWSAALSFGIYRSSLSTSLADLKANENKEQPDEIPLSIDLELNAVLSRSITPWMRVVAQLDLFIPGGFLLDESRAPLFRVWAGLDFVLTSMPKN